MTGVPLAEKGSNSERLRRTIGRCYRRIRFQWLNRDLLIDVSVATLSFIGVFGMSLRLPSQVRAEWGGGYPLTAVALVLVGVSTLALWRAYQFLKDEASYEDLRTERSPALRPKWLRFILRLPCTTVVIFSALVGIMLAFWLGGSWQVIRGNLLLVTDLIPSRGKVAASPENLS
jgi:hypothetical protein